VGIIDPLSLRDYEAHGGWQGLRAAAAMAPEAIVQQVLDSGLRGRGGAAFPAGIKWKTVAAAGAGTGPQKYIACNADEGDSGTFADRLLMEGDPFCLIEGMAIAGLAVGATQGYIYVRSEYPHAIAVLNEAIARASAAGWLGGNVAGSGKAFYLQVRKGAGSYVCGEETAMLESIEGKRGIVRAKPPLPAIEGLFGKPTVINNVITLATVPIILARARPSIRAMAWAARAARCRSSWPAICARRPGGGLRPDAARAGAGLWRRHGQRRPVKAIQVGGPLGSYVAPEDWDDPLDYEAYAAKAMWSAMAGWSCMTTAPIWRSWRAMPWSSAPSSPAANARPAASAPRAGGDRPHHASRRRRACGQCGAAREPVRHHAARQPVRHGRHDPLSGALGAAALRRTSVSSPCRP
jgi:formate dehydrogenase iron-sulfur subunit